MEQLQEQLQQILTQLQASEERQRACEQQIANFNQHYPVQAAVQYEDITTTITSGDQIQLESYRSIPEFSGNKGQYRSWRNQVIRRMQMIENFSAHPKYEAALGIIRAKITGPASDVLTNNKTAYNAHAIIERLDLTYADQRPLYVVEAEMTSIKQLDKTLQEFYDAINQSLNLVISKIVMTYRELNEQKSLIAEMQQKAVRTFIIGLKSQTTRNILYSHGPKDLAEAYTRAQTVHYDNQYLQLDQNRDSQRNGQTRGQIRTQQNNSKNWRMQQQPQDSTKFNVNMNCNQQNQTGNKQEPINGDSTNKFKQNVNEQQKNQQPYSNGPQKREYNTTRQHLQQPNKFQRINQLQDSESNPNEGYEGDICGSIPDDLISQHSSQSFGSDDTTTSSAFLDV